MSMPLLKVSLWRCAAWWFALLVCGAAIAAEPPPKAQACIACHGPGGNSILPETPSLAGQPTFYIVMQLFQFREKQRDIPQMTPFAADLSDQEAQSIAAYFSQQPIHLVEARIDAEKLAAGKQIVAGNHCASCHMPNLSGQNQMPRLAAQNELYLIKAMKDYRDGQRPGYDGVMTGILRGMTNRDLESVAHYLATFR